jgi:hypothetical protein
MSAMHDADLDLILRRAFPQGTAMLSCESGIALLNHGARTLIGTPSLALDVLGAKTAKILGQAVLALGERYVQEGRALLELAAADPSAQPKACSGTHSTGES